MRPNLFRITKGVHHEEVIPLKDLIIIILAYSYFSKFGRVELY